VFGTTVGVARLSGGQDLAAHPASQAREVVISRLRRTVRGLIPRTVQLCIHCQRNPAGFWVSRMNASVVRRPWCLTCCQDLVPSGCDVTPFAS